MTPGGSTTPEPGLLAAASLVLRSRGFDVETVLLSNRTPMLLAENVHVILGLVQFDRIDQLANVESAAALDLADRIAPSGAKRWDAYLMLLTEAPGVDQEMSPEVVDILYNTRYLRRMVRWRLAPLEDELTAALRPFLPLPGQGHGTRPADPLRLLVDRLPAHGVGRTDAEDAVSLWETAREAEGD